MGERRYKIEVWEVPSGSIRADERWQADCGECHARGRTPGHAVERLVAYMDVAALQERQDAERSPQFNRRTFSE